MQQRKQSMNNQDTQYNTKRCKVIYELRFNTIHNTEYRVMRYVEQIAACMRYTAENLRRKSLILETEIVKWTTQNRLIIKRIDYKFFDSSIIDCDLSCSAVRIQYA